MLEKEDLIKGATDDLLLQEAQSPTGSVPQFLVVSEIQRRKSMRDRFSAQEQQPEQSVAEQIVAGATPQGIGALQPEMPSQAPQMLPEMMAAQNAPMAPSPQMMAAGGGRMPYRRMAGGGIVPPNSLVEDASKFNPENLYDMDASQMAMASPTNMGIASVLPMAAGGVVRMQNEGQVPFTSMYGPQYDLNNNEINELGIAPLDPNLSERDKRILQREERDKIRKQRQAEIIAENREKLSNFYNSLNFGERLGRPMSMREQIEYNQRRRNDLTMPPAGRVNMDRMLQNLEQRGREASGRSSVDSSNTDITTVPVNPSKVDSSNTDITKEASSRSSSDAAVSPKLLGLDLDSKDDASSEEFKYGDILEFLKGRQGDSEQSQKERIGLALAQVGAGIARGNVAEGLEKATESAVLGSRESRKEAVDNMISAAQVVRFDDLRKERGLQQSQLILTTATSLFKESMEGMYGVTLDQQNALFNQIISQVTGAIDSGNFSGLGAGVGGVDPRVPSGPPPETSKASQYTVIPE